MLQLRKIILLLKIMPENNAGKTIEIVFANP